MKQILTIIFLFFAIICNSQVKTTVQAGEIVVRSYGNVTRIDTLHRRTKINSKQGIIVCDRYFKVPKTAPVDTIATLLAQMNDKDAILFERGGEWRTTVTIPTDNIKIGNYGTGAKPRILGSTKLTAWSSGSIGGVAANNNIMVESFEGTGYQNTWTETIGANTGNLVDQDNTEATPTNGTQCLKIVKSITPTATTAASQAQTQRVFDVDNPIAYIDFRVKVTAHGLTTSGDFLNLYRSMDASAVVNTGLMLRNLSGEIKFSLQAYEANNLTGTSWPSTGSITLNQWYRIQIKYDATNLQYSLSVDGTLVRGGAITGTPKAGTKRIILGDNTLKTLTAYFDAANVSSTNFESTGTSLPANVWASNEAISDPYGLQYDGNAYFIETDNSVKWGRVKKANTAACITEYDWTVTDNRLCIYSPTDPNTRYSGVEVAQRVTALSLNDKNYITIDGLEIAYSGSYGIRDVNEINMTGLTIKNCHIHHIGIKSSLAGYGIEQCHSNALIQNNVIHDSGRRNISLDLYGNNAQVSNITIEDNTLYNGFHTTGVDINSQAGSSLTNVIIRRNLIYNELTGAIDAIENHGSGFIYISRDGSGDVGNIQIHDNVFKNVTSGAINFGAGVGGSSSTFIYNNTFYGVSDYITSDYAAMFLIQKGSNAIFKNNIFYNNAKLSVTTLFSVFNVLSDAGTIVLDNNLYYNTEATRLIGWRGTSYSTAQLAAFRTATSQELHGIVGQNPLFVSASDYHLQTGSPAINAGVDIGLTTDYEGNPIVGVPDIGAYEKQ